MKHPKENGDRRSAEQVQTSASVEEDRAGYLPVETHLIRSKFVAQTFKVQVMQPIRRGCEDTRFPVIYATDGNFQFEVLKGIAYGIQACESGAPRFMVVGIGYPGDSPFAGSVLKARDFTFPRYPKLNVTPSVEGVLLVEEGAKDFYGAEDFQRFIGQELVPLIDEKYRTLPGKRTYFGHSGGGGFGLFTLFTQSDLFENYIISSPGLIYHGESSAGIRYENYDFALQYARDFIASGKSLDGIRVYMSVGADEEFEPDLVQWQLTSSFYRMAALMQAAAIQGLQLTVEVFPGEKHMTAWPIAFIRGVRAVFDAEVRSGTIGARAPRSRGR